MKSQLDKPNKQSKPEKPARTTHPLLGVTMGDPAGIGPEVIAKALAGKGLRRSCCPIVIGSVPVMEQTIKSLKLKLKVVRVEGHDP